MVSDLSCSNPSGMCFKLCKDFQKSIDAYKQAAKAHQQCRVLYAAGKALESASASAKELKKDEEAVDLLVQAGVYFRQNGTPDAAALALEKAGTSYF